MGTLFMAAAATLVFCAPGYPGAAGDAQPFVDQFAKALASSAGWSSGGLAAVYDPSEQGGLGKLGDKNAILTFVPYAFYVQHAAALHLSPVAQADVIDVGTQERWTLFGKTGGSVSDAASLRGHTILSTAGYAPDFVTKVALAAWSVPADVKIEQTGQLLSALRRVASGEPVVALLDQTQTAALATLPFAAQVKPLLQSALMPVALLAVVDSRLPPNGVKPLQTALLKMNAAPANADALTQLRLKGFVAPKLPEDARKP